MDYTQEQLFRMQQFDGPRMPFYMSYPMQNLYLTEMEYEKDMDRMKELYPKEVKQITELVDEECDKMEYEGSLMFDEYPDRMMLERVTDRIYQRMQEKENSLTAEQYYGPPPPGGMGPGDAAICTAGETGTATSTATRQERPDVRSDRSDVK